MRHNWAATTSVAGVAEAAGRLARLAKGQSSHAYVDCSQHHNGSADCSKPGVNADMPGADTAVNAMRNSGGEVGAADASNRSEVPETENYQLIHRHIAHAE